MIVLALVGVVLINVRSGGSASAADRLHVGRVRECADRTTAILAALFFILRSALGVLSRYEGRPTDILNRIPSTTGQGRRRT